MSRRPTSRFRNILLFIPILLLAESGDSKNLAIENLGNPNVDLASARIIDGKQNVNCEKMKLQKVLIPKASNKIILLTRYSGRKNDRLRLESKRDSGNPITDVVCEVQINLKRKSKQHISFDSVRFSFEHRGISNSHFVIQKTSIDSKKISSRSSSNHYSNATSNIPSDTKKDMVLFLNGNLRKAPSCASKDIRLHVKLEHRIAAKPRSGLKTTALPKESFAEFWGSGKHAGMSGPVVGMALSECPKLTH